MLSLLPLRRLFSEKCLRPFSVRLFLRLGPGFILLFIILRACREVGGVLVYHSYSLCLLSPVVTPHLSSLIADFNPLAVSVAVICASPPVTCSTTSLFSAWQCKAVALLDSVFSFMPPQPPPLHN